MKKRIIKLESDFFYQILLYVIFPILLFFRSVWEDLKTNFINSKKSVG